MMCNDGIGTGGIDNGDLPQNFKRRIAFDDIRRDVFLMGIFSIDDELNFIGQRHGCYRTNFLIGLQECIYETGFACFDFTYDNEHKGLLNLFFDTFQGVKKRIFRDKLSDFQ